MDDEYSGGLVSEHLWIGEDQTEDNETETGLPWCVTDRLLWE